MPKVAFPATMLVIDTNIVLDLWVFQDPAMQPLLDALRTGAVTGTGAQAGLYRWCCTTEMRDELVRVLGYPKIARRMAENGLQAEALLEDIAAHWALLPTPVLIAPTLAMPAVRCADPDDQKFIDLALHLARQGQGKPWLLSKDHAVLCLTKPLLRQGVKVSSYSQPTPCALPGLRLSVHSLSNTLC
jgi:predicted nucleic acid-binding protein